ncbi:hypothetical protein ERJ75_001179900 [Trypanosoma vivax]|nr:hypothetical protein TRVL_05243 [Trypanosoma vivax]KAH8609668.1 hypothetical protein ERJ75_001179900 [Trypanosoma vivax]
MNDAAEREALFSRRKGSNHRIYYDEGTRDESDDLNNEAGGICGFVQKGFSGLYSVCVGPFLALISMGRNRSALARSIDEREEIIDITNTTSNCRGSGCGGTAGSHLIANNRLIPPRPKHGRISSPINVPAAGSSVSQRGVGLSSAVSPQDQKKPLRSVSDGADSHKSLLLPDGVKCSSQCAQAAPEVADATLKILSILEDERVPLKTFQQLAMFLERVSAYLPVRVEAEKDINWGGNQPALRFPSMCHVCLQVLGPIRCTSQAAVLGLLEDILLEDCVATSVSITSIHFADIIFSPETAGTLHGSTLSGSSAYLDVLPSLGSASAHSSGAVVNDEALMKECNDRLCAFAKNMLESCAHIRAVSFTRCSFSPSDLGRGLRLPLTQLRRLRFEKCPLTVSHIDALLRLARATNRQSSGAMALQYLEELQLCGSLTDESVGMLLSYFSDELLGDQASLISLRLPTPLVHATRTHRILERYPHLVVTGT